MAQVEPSTAGGPEAEALPVAQRCSLLAAFATTSTRPLPLQRQLDRLDRQSPVEAAGRERLEEMRRRSAGGAAFRHEGPNCEQDAVDDERPALATV